MAEQNSADVSSNLDTENFEEYTRARQEPPSGAGDKPAESAVVSETTEVVEQATEPKDAEEAEDADSGDEGSDEDTEREKQPKKKGGYQKKIDKLTRRARELEERNAEIERQLAEKSAAEKPATAIEDKPAAEGKPKPEDFDEYDNYVEALTDWKLAQSDKAKAAAEREANQKKQQQNVANAWEEKKEAAREAADDFDEVMNEAKHIIIPGHVQEALLDDENGPMLAYRLAKDPEQLERIKAMKPIAAIRELGRLSDAIAAELKAKTTPTPKPPKKTTSAPAPVTPVNGKAASPTPSVHDAELANDFPRWEAQRRAALQRK